MSNVRLFTYGSLAQDSEEGIVILTAESGGSVYMTLHDVSGSDYQVPSGYTLYITGIAFENATYPFIMGYGDDGVAKDNVAPPTNWVELTSRLYPAANTGKLSTFIVIPEGKYPCVEGISAANYLTFFSIKIQN